MHEYQMQNAAARRAEASNNKKGIRGTVLFMMLLVCTAAVGWGGYQYKQALSLEELQRKHTRLAAKLPDDVTTIPSDVSSSSGRCKSDVLLEGETGPEGVVAPPSPQTGRKKTGQVGGEDSKLERESKEGQERNREQESGKDKEDKNEAEEEEVKEDAEIFWRRVALLASLLCSCSPSSS
ncbi:hypothetical protein CLOM_g3134 [Closterium sp. NIES-68]|nr:hypothetical protein CLOM_g3134 [Closterium sp. NIES-68]